MKNFKKNFLKPIFLILATLIILFNLFPSFSGETEFGFSNVSYEPEKPKAGDELSIIVEIISDANITNADGEWEYEQKGVPGYGPAIISHGAIPRYINRTGNIWRYRITKDIDKDYISPLKLTINATDENGKEIKKDLTISFEGGYKPSGGSSSNGSPGFETVFLLIAILIIVFLLKNSKNMKKNQT